MKFVALKETQKKYIIKGHSYSAMTELYDDEEVCNLIECDVIKDAYPFSLKNNDIDLFGDDAYSKKYTKYLFEFIYNDKPLNEVIKKVDDITKIYTFSLKIDESNVGLIIFIIFLILTTSTILSLLFIFIKELENRFQFLSKDLWVITTLGSLILICSLLTLYGEINNMKCQLKITLINMGFILSICPSLQKLITNFPARNIISLWFEKNKYISILIIMIFTGCLNGILAISSYDLLNVNRILEEKNYLKCNMNNIFGGIIYYIIQIYDIIIILISLILIYAEWNIEETSLDVNFLSTALFMDILSIILFNIIDKINFENYIMYNLLLAINIFVFSVSNHLFIYFIRILPIFGNNDEESKIIKELLNSDLNDSKKFSNISSSVNASSIKHSEYEGSIKTEISNNSKLKKFSQILVNYHNQKNICRE